MSRSVFVRFSLVAATSVLLANCATAPNPSQRTLSAQNQREIGAFSNKAKYGSASPRVVSHDQAVPKGGGRDHVGKPYRIAGRWYTPRDNPNYSSTGMSSWYGDAFHGRKTANGEIYDKHSYTAAHPTMPLPSYARVTNTNNGRSIIVRVNDRGPFHGGRIIDVSERVANALEFKHLGTARVKVDYVSRASTAGSDDRKLIATLRTDGEAAHLPGGSSPVPSQNPILVADATPPAVTPRPVAAAPVIPAATAPAFAPTQPAAQPAQNQGAPQAPAEEAAKVIQTSAPVRRSVPLPPDRPFDLGTIPGAGTPIGRVNNGQSASLPSRTQPSFAAQRAEASSGEKVSAIYFAPATSLSAAFGLKDPMRHLKNADAKSHAVTNAPQRILAGAYRDKGNADRIAAVLAKHGKVQINESVSNGTALYQVVGEQFANPATALQATKAAGARDARFLR